MLIGSALAATAAESPANGLLFYLSGDHGTTADFSAAGTAVPTFDQQVTLIPDGARGGALRCGDLQRLAWSAPGNIYAQRGTLSFFWRSRYAVGPTEFPIFRVGYADHSSWDMVWLRIDYNGHGFDAFVTDTGLARTRVSVELKPFPAPDAWTHLALAWDETRGIRFYVNGRLAATKETTAVYDAGLDQFGPHSRIISPYNVQSDYNFVRGGDLDELRIYDHLLGDGEIAALARGEAPQIGPAATRSVMDPAWRAEWWHRFGWDQAEPPPYLADASTTVRKVEIHDAYDLKRWWWKATDGIRETTWPGVYNRSRLPGRHDYFTLPDWDCYSTSGRAITFTLPDEPWNQIEIVGAAWGRMQSVGADSESTLFTREKGREKTIHRLAAPHTGGQIRFENTEPEEPISELVAYNVTPGHEPDGSRKLRYWLQQGSVSRDDASLAPLFKFIDGRYPVDGRAILFANPQPVHEAALPTTGLPFVHVLIPNSWDKFDDGLDGIAIDLPALPVQPTHGSFFPLNIRVKDPLWPSRDVLDFTFSVKPGERRTLWLDLRDRLLPPGQALYLTIAGAGGNFSSAMLESAELRLVFKPRAQARAEHELDRFTQARDAYAMLVEENPRTAKFALWNRFRADLADLLRVNPDHSPGAFYGAVAGLGALPPYTLPAPPAGVPRWAFLQTELLGRVQRFVDWYLDHRQIDSGESGGGISDDTDLLNLWPGVALMGIEPDRIAASDRRLLDAAYANGMFTHGLPTIQTDELHSYEEGINALGQNLILAPGDPRQLERAMETTRGLAAITGINAAGHRHIKTSYFSGTKIATDEPWGYAKAYSYLALQPAQLLADYNGNPAAVSLLRELADGLLAHRTKKADGHFVLPGAIRFVDDDGSTGTRNYLPWPLFWQAWQWTGDRRYLDPITDLGPLALSVVNFNLLDALALRDDWRAPVLAGEGLPPGSTTVNDVRGLRQNPQRYVGNHHFVWQLTGDKTQLETAYGAQIRECDVLEYINTEGSLWIDRVGVPTADLQRARLGGVALSRNATLPGNIVSWRFAAPATGRSVALLIPDATPTSFKVIAYNLETVPVRAAMTGGNIDPGMWEMTQGLDTDDDDRADQAVETREVPFARSRAIDLTLAPRVTTVLTFKLKTPGSPVRARPDLGIGDGDVVVRGREVRVTMHSLGSVPTPATTLSVRDPNGFALATAQVPAMAAPVDLIPKTVEVLLTLPTDAARAGLTVEIDPDGRLEEITRLNNALKL